MRSSYVTDGLGNTLALLDSTGAKTDTFDYFPSGNVAARTGTTPTPFQWNGGSGYFQDSASRVYVRARHFYTNLGRWNMQDPIGFEAGDYNLYRYCGNNFVNQIDPSGLIVCCQVSCHINCPDNDADKKKRFIFGWGCGNNRTEAIKDATNGEQQFSANERMKVWNRIHDLHCYKRHCRVVKCQDKKFEKKPIANPNPNPVPPPIKWLANCSDWGLIAISIGASACIVGCVYAGVPNPIPIPVLVP
ncbi:MAG: RHS repeat-associated core domain-containing protein [Armatimonadetes bacterium]|nr:RHS repeat-associated core domain-containing protein [Armatimonadota bacterium]